ncbi:MAG: hypothetical protein ABIY55_32335 [Kofleriaceae bacterium]
MRNSQRQINEPGPVEVTTAAATYGFSRVDRDLEIVVPRHCRASVLLKLVERDERHRYYAWWLVVARHDLDEVSVHYRYTGEDTIRFDVPQTAVLSSASLQPLLAEFLAQDGTMPPHTPIIKGLDALP